MPRLGFLALATFALVACGGEPDGGLLEVHASYDPGIEQSLAAISPQAVEQFRELRTVRVNVQGGDVDANREVELRGPPPDVFVVRSPIAVDTPDDDLSVTLRVTLVRFTTDGEELLGCRQQTDVRVLEDAVNLVDVTLMPGDCP